MPLNARQVETAVADISIAAIKSWLKSRKLAYSAGTRDQIVERLLKLLRKGDLSEAEFYAGLCALEEASAKRVSLYGLEEEVEIGLRDRAAFARRMRGLGITISAETHSCPN